MADLEADNWFIDSWDASAGRAFCSFRKREPRRNSINTPAYFICPPFFSPEPLATRAVGLAATRGTFQFGFFIDDNEQAFDSVEEIVALVKRIYSSRGMWPNPGGTLPPTPPRPGPFDTDSVPLPPPPPLRDLKDRFADFSSVDESIEKGQKFDWLTHFTDGDDEARRLLSAAGAALFDELLLRLPKGKSEDRRTWQAASFDLHSLFERLGVANEIYTETKLGLRMVDETGRMIPSTWVNSAPLASLTSLYDLFERIPLPRAVRTHHSLAHGHDPTMLTLMSAAFSRGTISINEDLDVALLVFAAACVVTERPRLSHEIVPADAVRDAIAWLSSQLPDHKFGEKIEAIIREAPRRWYKFETGTLDPTFNPGGSGPPDNSPSSHEEPRGSSSEASHADDARKFTAQAGFKYHKQEQEQENDEQQTVHLTVGKPFQSM